MAYLGGMWVGVAKNDSKSEVADFTSPVWGRCGKPLTKECNKEFSVSVCLSFQPQTSGNNDSETQMYLQIPRPYS